jgi:4-carboxymuconolactone decarboxylase
MIAWTIIGQINQNAPTLSGSIGIALNRPEQLRAHLERVRANGVTKDEFIDVITHLAFYAGWPNAVNAVAIGREVYH